MKTNVLYKLGLVLSLIHLLGFFGFLSYLSDLAERDGQGPLLWIYWLFFDFPISMVDLLLFELNMPSRYVMYFVHGVLGTVWWFFIPVILYKVFKSK